VLIGVWMFFNRAIYVNYQGHKLLLIKIN